MLVVDVIKAGSERICRLKELPDAWFLPHWSWDETQWSLGVILCRHPTAMHPPAAGNNGTSGPYWPVSFYRCAFPSCRSPPGCSSCLCFLAPPHPPSAPSSRDGGSEHQPTRPVSHSLSVPAPITRRWSLICSCHI